MIRKASVTQGVTVNPSLFIVTQEWDSLPRNTFSELGQHTCDCFLSVKDFSKVATNIYPNPANGIVYIDAAQNIESVSIVSMTGEIVLEISNTAVSQSIKLNAEELKKGLYIVKVSFGDAYSVTTSSLIIQ